jgi:DNA-binding transcriptional LysR family regulator
LRDQAPRFRGGARLDIARDRDADGCQRLRVSLVPEIAAKVEVRDKRVALKRFAPPEPGRTIGLAWRKTSPRRDFYALGEVIKTALLPRDLSLERR